MQIQILAHGFTLNQEEERYINEKIKKLVKYAERLSDESSRVKVELNRKRLKTSGDGVSCQVTMFVPGTIIRGEIRASQNKEALDLVVDKLKKQIKRYKDRSKHRGNVNKEMVNVIADIKQDRNKLSSLSNIARRKIFSHTKPMHEEEAIEQMELLSHKFFLFLNEATGRHSVAYKREEGDYGIIEMEM